jgi:hypothetical protein
MLFVRENIWDFDNGKYNDEIFIITVDGTHCHINKPWSKPRSASWFPEKHNQAGVLYELGIRNLMSVSTWFVSR